MGSEWQPIETAPRDGTKVDLWLVDQDGRGWRETDAYYVIGRAWERSVWADNQWKRVTPNEVRDGWWAPHHDYDGADGWCDEPRFFNPHPRQNKWIFTEPTHWMPLPPSPTGAKDNG